MSLLNKFVHELNEVNRLAATVYKAEKSQVPYIRAESTKQFQVSFNCFL